MPLGLSTNLANLPMETYGIGNKESKYKSKINSDTSISNEIISPRIAASTKKWLNEQMEKI